MAIIKARNLTKKFKQLTAVDNVNLEVEAGECFGLLGPNGAGKTSLIRMIIAVSPPTAGEIEVFGLDLKVDARQVKACLGVMPQNDNLDPDLTVLQNLLTFARYFDIPRDEARLSASGGITPISPNHRVSTYIRLSKKELRADVAFAA